ncbi:E3 ubiquitin-protein ligase RNF139 isoform X2 [Zalophus californianus]|uniref:E3 ubiquitin-protein ligase RNF139 isoform X2 n=1 Tax=Zalophus californianus TaxID=9704 RepID=A0A6J2FDN0_ZALCA|nr:E3 ubiquitin-protein ligase RNF139 isoform X2 [Zalophus californianus]
MAAVGPPQQQVRMAHQQVWAALEVALRVPCLYIIDAIFNSYYDSSQSRFCIGLQIFLRLLGIFVSSIVLILSQRSLFKFYMYSSAFLLAATSVLNFNWKTLRNVCWKRQRKSITHTPKIFYRKCMSFSKRGKNIYC